MNNQFKLIAFDLDGTLLHSLPDLALSLILTLEKMQLPCPTEKQVESWVGNGVNKLIQRALQWASPKIATEEMEQHARELFAQFYANNLATKSQLYPDVKSTLTRLTEKGYALALVTNKPSRYIAPILQAFQLEHLFELTLGGQCLPAIKPHPAPLYYLCGHFGLYPKQILFVGDSKNDILAAHHAGCPVIGLTYGYNYGIPIADANPDWVLDHFADILKIA